MKGKYKRTQGWCDHCDRDIVEAGKKCKCCGQRQPAKKINKAMELLKEIRQEVKTSDELFFSELERDARENWE